MPEALARSQNDSVLSRPARRGPRKASEGLAASLLRALLSRPARTIAGAALAAVLTGIVVNALVMQKERRSTPFYAAEGPAAVGPERPAAGPAPRGEPAPVAAQPPARPADLGAATASAPTSRGDPIRDLLRGDAAREAARLTVAAQTALVRLGYPVKPDGVAGASTVQAIAQFERSHGIGPSGEITVRLVRQLTAAANAAAR